MREILARFGAGTELAVVEDGKVCEYRTEEAPDGAAAGTVLLGRVTRVVPGMNAAFVDIGREKNGFLPLEERSRFFAGQAVREGMPVAVQVHREEQGVKGAFLTRDIALSGEYVLYMPMSRYVGVSQRIADTAERSRLKELGEAVTGGEFGLVLRTAADGAPEEAVAAETAALRERWAEAEKRMPTAHVPSVLYQPKTALEALLDDYVPKGVDRLVTDCPERAACASGRCPVERAEGDFFRAYGVEKEIGRALHRVVWLKSGGNLVIDPCEALTVIDVNTAKFTGKAALPETVLRTNLEACREAARQIRLRNIGGIILIDMIDMDAEEDRRRVLGELTDALRADSVKTVVHGYTSLGLIEMTRKRSRRTLRETRTEPCPRCGGTGRVRRNTEEETDGGQSCQDQ